MLRSETIEFFLGVRDGKNVYVRVPGSVDERGREYVGPETADLLQSLLRGEDVPGQDYREEPLITATSEVDSSLMRVESTPNFKVGVA